MTPSMRGEVIIMLAKFKTIAVVKGFPLQLALQNFAIIIEVIIAPLHYPIQ